MDLKEYYKSVSEQFDTMLNEGNVADAVRVTGEALAVADGCWTERFNRKEPNGEELRMSNLIGTLHVEALLHAGAYAEGFSTAMLLLLRSASFGEQSVELDKSCVMALYLSIIAELRFMENSGDLAADATVGEHASAVVTLLASMLYDMYRKISSSDAEFPALSEIYPLLKDLEGNDAIQWPEVEIDGRRIAVGDYREMLADAVGRARAISLFAVE